MIALSLCTCQIIIMIQEKFIQLTILIDFAVTNDNKNCT